MPDLWRLRRRALTRWLLPAAIAATGAWSFVLLGRTPDFVPWLRFVVVGGSVSGANVTEVTGLSDTALRSRIRDVLTAMVHSASPS